MPDKVNQANEFDTPKAKRTRKATSLLFEADALQKVDAIKKTCGFGAEFDLLRLLRNVAFELNELENDEVEKKTDKSGATELDGDTSEDDSASKVIKPISGRQKKAFAEKVRISSITLIDLLSCAGDEELAHLIGDDSAHPITGESKKPTDDLDRWSSQNDVVPGLKWSHMSPQFFSVIQGLTWLVEIAKAANERKSLEGRRPNYRMNRLLLCLREIYVQRFGEQIGLKKNIDGTYSGPFLDFVFLSLSMFLEKTPPNTTFGRKLDKAIRDQRSRKQSEVKRNI